MNNGKLFMVLTVGLAVAVTSLTGCAKKPVVQAPVTQAAPAPAAPTRPAPQPQAVVPTPQAPARVEEGVPANLAFSTVYFDYDKSVVRDDQRSALDQNAQLLTKYRSVTIRVEGHCDERGTEEYNMALGQRRADAVVKYLTDYGIAASRVTTVSYGEMRPAATGSTEDVFSKNRRAEIVITGK